MGDGMKKVFIYGDSNTWGDNFISGRRIEFDKQWPNILKERLGNDYLVYQEGLPGRLAGSDELIKTYKNGKDTFIATFRTKAPVDFVFIMLGTNDLQMKYNKSADSIIKDLLWYQECIKQQFDDIDDRKKYFVDNKMPKIYYILPPNFNEPLIFNEQSSLARESIINYFANSNFNYVLLENMPLFDDGIHLNYDGHRIVADKIYEVIKNG